MIDEIVVDVKNLNKSFAGKPVVIDMTLQIKKGQIFGFLGPNGSGKTTFLRMLCGLITPDSGQGMCLGYDIFRSSHAIKKLVGYVPQTFSLYEDLTVKENLDFIARIYEIKNARKSVDAIIDRLLLKPYQSQLTAYLSGGWKQRVSLAAALLHDPKLLLLDEPTAGVDPKARRDFWNEIHQLTSEGISVLVSTHYIDEAERCNRLAYMAYGHLLVEGSLQEVIQHPELHSWSIVGKNLSKLAELLAQEPSVQQISMLGNELRICTDVDNFSEKMQSILPNFTDYQWRAVPSNLEEVFIYLVNNGKKK